MKLLNTATLLFFGFLLLPQSVLGSTTPTICVPGYVQGNVPTSQVPDYSYSPDGFLELHFRLDNTKWRINYGHIKQYYSNCNQFVGGYGVWLDKQSSPWPGVKHLLIRYYELQPGFYSSKAYNGDTGQLLPLDPESVFAQVSSYAPYYSNTPIVRLIFGNRDAAGFDWQTETGDLISTPALPMKITPGKTPVLIVPGVLGTDINNGNEKLWLDLGHNLTDIGDGFMDPLKFKTDLTPENTSLTIGDVIKNPLIGQHFYDLLIQELQNQGYIEGVNLFTFPCGDCAVKRGHCRGSHWHENL